MTLSTGLKNAITDVDGLRVGNAEDRQLKTGTTVLTSDRPFTASMHVMGGAPGTFDTELLAPDKMVSHVDALVLSGGSAFGLAACSGVMEALAEQNRGFEVGAARVPITPGAIIFDLLNGAQKTWHKNPYHKLGQRAFHAANDVFNIGSYGAGTGALSANIKGGLGTASHQMAQGWTIGALVVVNPVGGVTPQDGQSFWAAPFEVNGEYGGLGLSAQSNHPSYVTSLKVKRMELESQNGANTTLAIVATDAPLSKAQCHRLAISAHDGDVVFGVSTNSQDQHVDSDALMALGAAASTCLSRAIARGVYEAHPEDGDLLPCFSRV